MRGLREALMTSTGVPDFVLDDVMSRYGETLIAGRHLVDSGQITDQALAESVALAADLKFVDLHSMTLDPEVVGTVPGTLCRRARVLPVGQVGDLLTLAMVDPTDIIAIDDVGSVTGLLVMPVVASYEAMSQALDRYVRSDVELSEISAVLEDAAEVTHDHDTDQDSDAPVVRFVNLLISQAISDRASDIHIEPGSRSLKVRYRIDGVLKEVQSADRAIQAGVISRLKIMSDIDIAERRKPQDGRMSVAHDGRAVDLRVATLPTVWGEKIVMRILDNTDDHMTLDDLHMSEVNLARFRDAISKPHGMILVTGPTGSGKSTTLYTTLHEVASPKVNVITVEDPVEKRIDGINQVQTNPKAGLTFATALRSILRSDPDIVLVGEIRDVETAVVSVEASLTGHLVLSTLHTNDAPSAMTRLAEIGVEPFLVGTAVTCVVAQRLARRLCERCKEAHVETPEVLQALRFPIPEGQERVVIYRATGCTFCAGTGYRGRIALHEVLPITEEIEKQVVLQNTGSEIRETAVRQGMVSLRDDGLLKVLAGHTTIEEVLRVAA